MNLANQLDDLVKKAVKEQADINFYSGGSKVNKYEVEIISLLLSNHKTIFEALTLHETILATLRSNEK